MYSARGRISDEKDWDKECAFVENCRGRCYEICGG